MTTDAGSVPTRAHLSIGEVLSLLQDEYPDITISKIRFLESQGLLDPERTPSGYRKFYDADIERLRWILRQQKEHFLPLKVIKDRLASGELDIEPEPNVEEVPVASVSPEPPTVPARPSRPARGLGDGARPAGRDLLDAGESSVSLSADELARAVGLTNRQLAELERYGIVEARTLGSTKYYDDEALLVAKACASFLERGLESRHLRMYKVAAEREASLYEQLIIPMLKRHRPGARAEALQAMGEVAELGDQLHRALLRRLLRDVMRPV